MTGLSEILRAFVKRALQARGALPSKNAISLSRSHSSHFFELNRLKLCTTLGTVGCVAGKPPRRLHFFRHRTKLIEVLT
jgi:hypothetical protein